jgi:fibronectin type 3 domain-containing protein
VIAKKNLEGEGLRVEATPKDLTPPSAPRNVKAEKRGSVVQVSWLQNKEDDLAGYNVYRVTGRSEQKLTKTPTKDTVFIDHTIGDNRYLSYYVTSVDLSGNESEQSREAIIILKE